MLRPAVQADHGRASPSFGDVEPHPAYVDIAVRDPVEIRWRSLLHADEIYLVSTRTLAAPAQVGTGGGRSRIGMTLDAETDSPSSKRWAPPAVQACLALAIALLCAATLPATAPAASAFASVEAELAEPGEEEGEEWEFEVEEEEDEEEFGANAGALPPECLLRSAEPTVATQLGDDKLRLTLRYTTEIPTRVAVVYWLKGGKGSLQLGSTARRFGTQGVLRMTRHLDEREIAKVRAARTFVVDLDVAAAPAHCDRYLTLHLNAKSLHRSRATWSARP